MAMHRPLVHLRCCLLRPKPSRPVHTPAKKNIHVIWIQSWLIFDHKLSVHRLGFGAMRLTGDVRKPAREEEQAIAVARIELPIARGEHAGSQGVLGKVAADGRSQHRAGVARVAAAPLTGGDGQGPLVQRR
jgi:hypothetical protein